VTQIAEIESSSGGRETKGSDADGPVSSNSFSSNENASASKEGAGSEVPGAAPDERAKKERVLHTRVPAVLERELKRFADNLRVPVSNLVRTILEDALNVADAATENVEERLKKAAHQLEVERERFKKRVMIDPLADVFAFQTVTLAQPATCVKCERDMKPGEQAHLGLSDAPARPGRRIFACDSCLPK
jgi:hypothetical protein